MKWFKHQSDLSRDEGIARYLDEARPDALLAYGFLMLVLEAIASRMNAGPGELVCSATYSIAKWGHITYSHANRVRKYLRLCEVIDWVHVEFEEGSCKVSIPRMVEWRDDYSRKSRHNPDKVAESRTEQNRINKRESRSEDALSLSLSKESPRRSPPQDFEISWDLQEWAANNYPSVDIHKETDKFLRHEYSRPLTDWNAAWKTWIQRGAEFQGKKGADSGHSSYTEQFLSLGKLMKVERRQDETTLDYCTRVKIVNQRRLESLSN